MRASAAGLLLIASCARGGTVMPSAGGGPEAAVHAMYEAFKARDLAAVGKHMTEDSTCYDAYTSQLLVGRKAVLDHFGAILARHQEGEKWESSLEDMKVTVSGDLAYTTYKVRTSAGGAHALAAVTHVFKKVDGRWLAVHLHRSWNTPR